MHVNDRKYEEIINKVEKFDMIKRKEILKQNKIFLNKLKIKRNSKKKESYKFPALNEIELNENISEDGYDSDFGLPKIKYNSKKNTVSRKSSSTQLSNNYDYEKKKLKIDFLIKENKSKVDQKYTLLDPFIELPPGNFFFPLKKNFKKSEKIKEDDDFYFKYFGDEKLDEVNNVIEKEYIPIFSKNTNVMSNCIKSNAILIEIFKHIDKTNILNCNGKYYDMIKRHFPGIKTKQFQDRMIMLFFRFKSKYQAESIFVYLSCKKDEEFCFDNIIGTFKEFMCSICLKYGCLLHGINQKVNYDNPEEYDMKSLLDSYSSLCNTVLNYYNEVTPNNEIVIESNNYDLIQDISNRNNELNVLRTKYLKTYISIETPLLTNECQNKCIISDIKSKQLGEKKTEKKEFSQIMQIYYEKLFRIFKYDACNITFLMNFLFLKPQKRIFSTQHRPQITKNKFFPIFGLTNVKDKFISSKENNEIKNIIYETSHSKFSERNNKIKCSEIFFKLLEKDISSIIYSLENDHKNLLSKQRINKRKKKTSIHKEALKKIKENDKNNTISDFKRCSHKGNEECTKENCECFARGFCEKYCICNKNICKIYRQGCTCKSNCMKQSCPCLARGIECDEDKCKGCFKEDSHKKCKNRQFFEISNNKILGVGVSNIAGWGIYAMEKINKGEFICEYTGEIISNEECEKREIWNDIEKYTYMFTLTNQSIIDAKMMGNKFRFANHSKSKQNSFPKIIFSQGSFKIGIFASKDITEGEEILFDYDGQNLLHAKYDWVDDLKKNKKIKLGGKRKREETAEMTVTSENILIKNTIKRNLTRLNKKLVNNQLYRTNDSYAKQDGFYIDIKEEESYF